MTQRGKGFKEGDQAKIGKSDILSPSLQASGKA